MYLLVELPCIWMMHLDSLLVSRELKGRTRTATFTEAPDILTVLLYNSSPEIKNQIFFWSYVQVSFENKTDP